MFDHRVKSATANYSVIEYGYAQELTGILKAFGNI